jgi:hypothetical protein
MGVDLHVTGLHHNRTLSDFASLGQGVKHYCTTRDQRGHVIRGVYARECFLPLFPQ